MTYIWEKGAPVFKSQTRGWGRRVKKKLLIINSIFNAL
jgi:hypothetical protein